MDKHEAPPKSHDAIPVREPDAPYAGAPGQTRYESVHLVEADGVTLRSVSVCRAINVRTHPELKVRALAGLLHRLDDGRELTMSFVYHDPDARKFALIVPSSLAHLELKEWSKLMAEIADDTATPVPAYVREMTTVLGIAALAGFIESGVEREEGDDPSEDTPSRGLDRARLLEIEARTNLIAQRERELAEHEHALMRLAELLTAREAELNRRREALDSERMQTREYDLRDHSKRAEQRTGSWQEVGVAAAADSDTTAVSEFPKAPAEMAYEGAVGFGDGARGYPPPLPGNRTRGSRPPPLPMRPRLTPPPIAPRRDAAPGGVADMRARARSEPPPLPMHDALVAESSDPEPNVAPPSGFVALPAGEMAYKLTDDELWLFVRVDEARASAFRHAADLMLQYVEVEGYPVFVLSLVDQRDPVYAVRHAFDGRGTAELGVLEHLCRSFRARVALYLDALYIETITVATLREGVAQAISSEISQLPAAKARITAAEAVPRAMEVPPPLRNGDLPFGPVRREAPTIVSVLASVEQLTAWLRPEKRKEATLTYSVPHHVIDATIRRVVRSAFAFGVALPDELLALAIEHGAAPDEASAVREQLAAFRQRVEAQQNDLGVEATRRNWDRLLAAADARHVVVDELTLGLSRAEPQLARDSQPTRMFEGATAAELRKLLGDPLQRVEAIRELCVRGHASAIEPVLAVLEALRPAEIAIALAQLSTFGEDVGDALINALASPSEAVRQCAALALGRLQLRRALVPMVKQLEAEDSPAHTEIARAFGDFGAPALRSVIRALPGSARPDRLVLALAHVANHGSAKEVEKLENDAEAAVAQAARKAMARRARMEWEDLSVREQRTLTDASPAARLSQAFYAEASKVAI